MNATSFGIHYPDPNADSARSADYTFHPLLRILLISLLTNPCFAIALCTMDYDVAYVPSSSVYA